MVAFIAALAIYRFGEVLRTPLDFKRYAHLAIRGQHVSAPLRRGDFGLCLIARVSTRDDNIRLGFEMLPSLRLPIALGLAALMNEMLEALLAATQIAMPAAAGEDDLRAICAGVFKRFPLGLVQQRGGDFFTVYKRPKRHN